MPQYYGKNLNQGQPQNYQIQQQSSSNSMGQQNINSIPKQIQTNQNQFQQQQAAKQIGNYPSNIPNYPQNMPLNNSGKQQYPQNYQKDEASFNAVDNLPPRQRNTNKQNSQSFQQNSNNQQYQQIQPQNQINKFKKEIQSDNPDQRIAKASGVNNLPVNEYADQQPLYPCQEGCGRSFTELALEKHQIACKKVFMEKRKVFNSQAHRIAEKDQIQYIKQLNKKGNQKPKPNNKQGAQKWKQQSEAFRAMLKQSNGQKLSQNEQEAFDGMNNIDSINCEFCGRNFSEQAGKRHIPFCEEQQRKKGIRKGQQPNKKK